MNIEPINLSDRDSGRPRASGDAIVPPDESTGQPVERIRYKFQRLRERLRSAIRSGELSGKLPGERALARQLRVNAKTLSKALTDLASEGLLDRRIGFGTFVRSAGSAAPTGHVAEAPRWLLACDNRDAWAQVLAALRATGALCEIRDRLDPLPTDIGPCSAVLDFCADTPSAITRELIVRGLAVIKVGHFPRTFSTGAVVFDSAQSAARLTHRLVLDGHRRLLVIENPGQSDVASAVNAMVQRLNLGASTNVGRPTDAPLAVRQGGVTAILCADPELGDRTAGVLTGAGIDPSADVMLTCVGVRASPAWPGFYAAPAAMVDAIVDLLRPGAPRRPVTLWLAGEYHDTIARSASSGMRSEDASRDGELPQPAGELLHPAPQPPAAMGV